MKNLPFDSKLFTVVDRVDTEKADVIVKEMNVIKDKSSTLH